MVMHAVVHTMCQTQPVAEAVAVGGNRILAVGGKDAIRHFVTARTRVIDAQGRLLVPGFNDAHVHFLSGGQRLASVDLRSAQSPQELAQRLQRFAAGLPPGRWITGGDWDHENRPGAPLPTKELIDPVTPDRPVFICRLDGHMGLANSVALRLGGVDRNTSDPPGGLIVRDPQTREPTGILKDAAMSLVSAKIPELTAGWVPEQKITVQEAVWAYTVGSAWAEFTDHQKGQLTPGMLADFVLLSQDIFTIAPAEIDKTRVVLTVVDGQVVYQTGPDHDP